MGPIVNVIALNLAYLVSGVVVVETIFAYPGLAKLMVDGVQARYPTGASVWTNFLFHLRDIDFDCRCSFHPL